MPKYILTRIDKPKQQSHQEKIGSIYISPKFLYMKYNLQHGDVVQIGARAARAFPDMQVGDTVLFRHTIESDDWRLLYKEPNQYFPKDYFLQDEFRVIDTTGGTEVLGYIRKSDGTWVANDRYIYVNADVKPMEKEHITSLLLSADGGWGDDEAIMRKIEQMKLDQENIKESIKSITDPYKLEDTYKYMGRIAQDMERLTKMIHAKKVCTATVEIVGATIGRELAIKQGSQILVEDYGLMYPLRIGEKNYLLIENEYVFGIMN